MPGHDLPGHRERLALGDVGLDAEADEAPGQHPEFGLEQREDLEGGVLVAGGPERRAANLRCRGCTK